MNSFTHGPQGSERRQQSTLGVDLNSTPVELAVRSTIENAFVTCWCGVWSVVGAVLQRRDGR